MVLFQIMICVKSWCQGSSRQYWRLKFWKLSLSTSCGCVDYNVMMNVAKKKRSSFPDSVWPSTNICGWCELECWWMGGHQYFIFFPWSFTFAKYDFNYTVWGFRNHSLHYIWIYWKRIMKQIMYSMLGNLGSELWKIPNISKLVVKSGQAHHSCSSATETS